MRLHGTAIALLALVLITQSAIAGSVPTVSSQMLEIPQASRDFVGVYGGYTSGTVYSPPGVAVGKSPREAEGVTFGHTARGVYLGAIITIAPDQTIVGTPKVTVVTPRRVVTRVEWESYQDHMVKVESYELKGDGTIACKSETDFYLRSTRELWGVLKKHATLTRKDAEKAARDVESTERIPQGEISTGNNPPQASDFEEVPAAAPRRRHLVDDIGVMPPHGPAAR